MKEYKHIYLCEAEAVRKNQTGSHHKRLHKSAGHGRTVHMLFCHDRTQTDRFICIAQITMLFFVNLCCPAPHGAGGLKSAATSRRRSCSRSCPTRGRWIEISTYRQLCGGRVSPAPHGAGGLKCVQGDRQRILYHSPAPHGAGGLKYDLLIDHVQKSLGPAPHGAGGLKSLMCLVFGIPYIVLPHTGQVD